MPSLAQLKLDVPHTAAAASEVLVAILHESGYTLDDLSVPGATELLFRAKRTMAWVPREGGAQITDRGAEATIELGIDIAPGQPSGLMDGRHNRKLVAELEDKITARLGRA